MSGEVLTDNARMIELAEALGFAMTGESQGILGMMLDLQSSGTRELEGTCRTG
jgi:hypothetical protein